MKRISWAGIQPHFIACVIFLAISFLYHYPTLTGKQLVQNDVVQAKGTYKEAQTYKDNGDPVLWTNSMFSGMPIWFGKEVNALQYVHRTIATILPNTVLLTFLAFFGFYLMMLPLKAHPIVAFTAASAFALSSFNLISLEAGHINKVFDMALMAPVFAGIFLAYKKKYIEGAIVTTLFLALHIYYGHYQITYYLFIAVLFYFVSEIIFTALDKSWATFIKASAILAICAIVALIPNISKLYTNYEYSKSTTRGGSELTERNKKAEGGGLDKEYALSWSNGVDEVLTIYTPYLYGGSSHEKLSTKSETAKLLRDMGIKGRELKNILSQINLYYGPQPFTSGPVYFGAAIIFLFIVGLFVVDNRYKWWLAAISIFSIMMSMGKNFEALTDVLFYHFPLYNKFRSVTMALSIAQLTMPLLAGLTLIKIMRGEVEKKKLGMGFITALSVCFIITLYGMFGVDGRGYEVHIVKDGETIGAVAQKYGVDEKVLASLNGINSELKVGLKLGQELDIPPSNGYPYEMLKTVEEDRISMSRSESIRVFFFTLLVAGLIWFGFTKSIKMEYAMIGVATIILIDLFWVDKRYLSADDFKDSKEVKQVYEATPADEFILKDKEYYRVFNLTKSPFNDATTSWFHHSIGGYSAIKLGRYQELIEYQLQKNNTSVLNMLNTRYVIIQDRQTGNIIPQKNPDALGNAWFVREVNIVENADAEIKALDSINPSKTVLVDKRFAKQLEGLSLSYDSSASVKFLTYHPDRLSYEYTASSDQVLVFSEIYYQPGWNAYLDGKLVDHFRCNYVLRGMKAPAGNHKVEFRFEPSHYYITENIAMAGSGIMVLLLGGLVFLWFKKTPESQKEIA